MSSKPSVWPAAARLQNGALGLSRLSSALLSPLLSGPITTLRRRARVAGKLFAASALLGLTLLFAATTYRSTLLPTMPGYLLSDRNNQFLAEIVSGDRDGYGYWTLSQLPERVVRATVELEDQRFWSHPGFDPVALARALWQNLSSQTRVSGASTLAMQLVRMQHPAARSYTNKLIETLAAAIMTLRYGRETVLSEYLRWVPYGNRIHGIDYAARRYLDKPVQDLSWAEIAFLAAIPQSPSRMNPFDSEGRLRAQRRGRHLLRLLHGQQVLSNEELQLALAQIGRLHMPVRAQRPEYSLHYIEKLQQQLDNDNARRHFYHNPRIKTTLDTRLQREVTQLSREHISRWRQQGAGNLSLIVLDKKTNEVLAWVGSADYFDSQYSGAIDYTQVQRSPGSVLKPFIYALAMERGAINAATVLDDLPMRAYPVSNSDRRFLGPLLPRQALSNSRNIPAIHVLQLAGLDETYGLFRRLALHNSPLAAQYYGLGLALGSVPVRLQDVMRAYAVLANDGVYRPLQWFVSPPQSAVRPERIFSIATARQISLFLSDPAARLPTFARMGATEYPFPVALKTGTSQGYRDAWTVAYSNNYIVGAWTGNPDPNAMRQLSGSASTAELVQQVLLRLHSREKQGLSDLNFPAPPHYVAVELCAHSGKLAGSGCDNKFQEWLAADQVPREVDNSYVRLVNDSRTGQPASAQTPPQFRRVKTLVNLPPRYADWVQTQGLAAAPVNGQDYNPRSEQPLMKSVAVQITSPADSTHVYRDPEAPNANSSITLSAVTDPPVAQLLWYVDNKPYKLTAYPYTTRLPLNSGRHIIQARVPLTVERSNPVAIMVE